MNTLLIFKIGEAGKKLPTDREKPDDESKNDSSSGFLYTFKIVLDMMFIP